METVEIIPTQMPIPSPTPVVGDTPSKRSGGRRKGDYTPEQWARILERKNQARNRRRANKQTPPSPTAALSQSDAQYAVAYAKVGGFDGLSDESYERGYLAGIQAVAGICEREIRRVS